MVTKSSPILRRFVSKTHRFEDFLAIDDHDELVGLVDTLVFLRRRVLDLSQRRSTKLHREPMPRPTICTPYLSSLAGKPAGLKFSVLVKATNNTRLSPLLVDVERSAVFSCLRNTSSWFRRSRLFA